MTTFLGVHSPSEASPCLISCCALERTFFCFQRIIMYFFTKSAVTTRLAINFRHLAPKLSAIFLLPFHDPWAWPAWRFAIWLGLRRPFLWAVSRVTCHIPPWQARLLLPSRKPGSHPATCSGVRVTPHVLDILFPGDLSLGVGRVW